MEAFFPRKKAPSLNERISWAKSTFQRWRQSLCLGERRMGSGAVGSAKVSYDQKLSLTMPNNVVSTGKWEHLIVVVKQRRLQLISPDETTVYRRKPKRLCTGSRQMCMIQKLLRPQNHESWCMVGANAGAHPLLISSTAAMHFINMLNGPIWAGPSQNRHTTDLIGLESSYGQSHMK